MVNFHMLLFPLVFAHITCLSNPFSLTGLVDVLDSLIQSSADIRCIGILSACIVTTSCIYLYIYGICTTRF